MKFKNGKNKADPNEGSLVIDNTSFTGLLHEIKRRFSYALSYIIKPSPEDEIIPKLTELQRRQDEICRLFEKFIIELEKGSFKGPTLASLDPDNKEEILLYQIQEREEANSRIRGAIKRLQEKGIIDEKGKVISDKWPEDMLEGSRCDL